jgi:outer membrane protein TolC
LVELATQENPSLRIAGIRILEARAQLGIAESTLYPQVQQLSGSVAHTDVRVATLGYGDIVMSEKHRRLGPLESVNGVLMIGVSTAALMAAFQDAIRKTIQARAHSSEKR